MPATRISVTLFSVLLICSCLPLFLPRLETIFLAYGAFPHSSKLYEPLTFIQLLVSVALALVQGHISPGVGPKQSTFLPEFCIA